MLAKSSLALLTDLYQLTMASAYWKNGRADREAVFHLFFRHHPFGGGYAVASGLADVVEYLANLRFAPDDLRYLATLTGRDSQPLFDDSFLAYLSDLRFSGNIDAIPEGTVVFAHEPLVRVQGPILQCQIVETALLNLMNFQTLIATKASRICRAARGEPVLEFGLRRAQGMDGAIAASRAAYVGGCAATSNVLAGRLFDIPVRGTHAHSWVMSYDDELESFQAYADALPNNCVFLVDTFDTLAGVRKAISVGRNLRKQGHDIVGIRLDSGDLNALSQEARRLLDEAGFSDAAIVASNDLDEYSIEQLKRSGARINVWGVGTRLATSYDQPALGGVYKLAAIRDDQGQWQHRVKLSEDLIKVSNPGIQQVSRYSQAGRFLADCIYDVESGLSDQRSMVLLDGASEWNPLEFTQTERTDLLVPVFRNGDLVYSQPSLAEIRQRTLQQLDAVVPDILNFREPSDYPVGLDVELHRQKQSLIAQAQQGATS